MTVAAAPLHVVAAVVRDRDARILLSLRLPHLDQGGLWEFPGGKVQVGEAPLDALRRELLEELGIVAETVAPLIKIRHSYAVRDVLLDVWEVEQWRGSPLGLEGQAIAWKALEELSDLEFPAANLSIITAVQLPRTYLITPEPQDSEQFYLELEAALKMGIRLVQFRAKQCHDRLLKKMARASVKLCNQYRAKILINTRSDVAIETHADGVHLTSAQLATLSSRPLPSDYLIGASVHNAQELERAASLGVDFVVIGPVLPTASHADREWLGWERLKALVASASIPVFALGGQNLNSLAHAVNSGCQGIAAIRSLWNLAENVEDRAIRRALAIEVPDPDAPLG